LVELDLDLREPLAVGLEQCFAFVQLVFFSDQPLDVV
jgi:hypothetical protein